MNPPPWIYGFLLYGHLPHECRLKRQGEELLWTMKPVDENDGDGVSTSCLQPVSDFRKYGPPETPAFLKAPPEVLEAVCQALEISDPAWRKPLPAELQEWFQAAEAADIPRLETCWKKGVQVDVPDRQGRRALHLVAGHFNAARWLLETGKADPNVQDRYGFTGLMLAARSGNAELVDLYKHQGADRELRDLEGRTAWLTGVENRAGGLVLRALRYEVTRDWPRALLSAAFNSDAAWMEGEDWFVRAKGKALEKNPRLGGWKRTPIQLWAAGLKPHWLALRWLVENGAALTDIDEGTGNNLLHEAVRHDCPRVIPLLVQACVDPTLKNKAGLTPLDLALPETGEKLQVVTALAQAGVRPHPQDAAHVRLQKPWLVRSRWIFEKQGDPAKTGTALFCYASVPLTPSAGGEDLLWMEFPAAWCRKPPGDLKAELLEILQTCRTGPGPRGELDFLTQESASEQPWNWPGRELWIILPDRTGHLLKRAAESRDPAGITGPGTFQNRRHLRLPLDWTWEGQDYAGPDKFSVKLRQDQLIWEASNSRRAQSIGRFKVEGPPQAAGHHRTIPKTILNQLCAAVGEVERIWEKPSSNEEREAFLAKWESAEKAPENVHHPEPPPHHSGHWCYAELEIDDHFHNASGSGSEGAWTCWMEFPAEWCYNQAPHLDFWLTENLKRAYAEMNRKVTASGEGGHYAMNRCYIRVLDFAEAARQPWTPKGKVLYQTDGKEAPPRVIPDEEKNRPRGNMGDPANPPMPIPISPPPRHSPRPDEK